MDKIEIEDIHRLNVVPGDVLLVTLPRLTPDRVVQDVKNFFETQLPVRAIVKTADVQVEVVHAEAAE